MHHQKGLNCHFLSQYYLSKTASADILFIYSLTSSETVIKVTSSNYHTVRTNV
jgi:hypothetical protein